MCWFMGQALNQNGRDLRFESKSLHHNKIFWLATHVPFVQLFIISENIFLWLGARYSTGMWEMMDLNPSYFTVFWLFTWRSSSNPQRSNIITIWILNLFNCFFKSGLRYVCWGLFVGQKWCSGLIIKVIIWNADLRFESWPLNMFFCLVTHILACAAYIYQDTKQTPEIHLTSS